VGRKSLKETRQKEIIKGFYEVAKKEGLENTSIGKVANHLGINPSLILHYFSTREQLIYYFVDFILERYAKIFLVNGEEIDSKEKVEMLVSNLFSRKWNRYVNDGVFYSVYAQTFRDKKIRKLYKHLHDNLRLMLNKALKSAKENNVIEIDNIDQITDVIYTMVDGSYYYLSMVDEKETKEQMLDGYRKYVLNLINLN
jgi:AcrR family transcriptional regulator